MTTSGVEIELFMCISTNKIYIFHEKEISCLLIYCRAHNLHIEKSSKFSFFCFANCHCCWRRVSRCFISGSWIMYIVLVFGDGGTSAIFPRQIYAKTLYLYAASTAYMRVVWEVMPVSCVLLGMSHTAVGRQLNPGKAFKYPLIYRI